MGNLLGVSSFGDQVSIEMELPDERIDLFQADGWRGLPLQVATDQAIVVGFPIVGGGAGFFHTGRAVLFEEAQHALNAAHRFGALAGMHRFTERADVGPRAASACQQFEHARRRFRRTVLCGHAMPATLLLETRRFQGRRHQD